MISIKNKEDCCGCQACMNICPSNCIKMLNDSEGFLYPRVDSDSCLGCNLCEDVCPMKTTPLYKEPLICYAARTKDPEVLIHSSSGGVFTLLANRILDDNGVVFGAKFNKDFGVYHSFCEEKDDLADFQGSKYLQSDTGFCYNEVKRFLEDNRPVLFTGTPCQIAGLKCFLNNDYDNLYLVSVICHGVASPGVWKSYLEWLSPNNPPEFVNFRSKKTGWCNYSLEIKNHSGPIIDTPAMETSYMKAFLSDYILRPSCYCCPFKGKQIGDLIIGDFWGIGDYLPDYDDDKGVSLVIINNDKGYSLFHRVDAIHTPIEYIKAFKHNISLVQSAPMPIERAYLFKKYNSKGFAAINSFILKKERRRFSWAMNRYRQVKNRIKLFVNSESSNKR